MDASDALIQSDMWKTASISRMERNNFSFHGPTQQWPPTEHPRDLQTLTQHREEDKWSPLFRGGFENWEV